MAEEFLLKGTDFVKAAFAAALRAAYQAQVYYSIYKYSSDDTLTGLSIYESYPKRPLKVPGLYISTSTGDISRSTLDSEDFLMEQRATEQAIPTGKYGWGKIDSTVQIKILGITDRDRRKLTDLTALFCRHLFTDKFSAFGIGYRDIKIGGEQEEDWQGQTLYTNTLTIPCYSEFQVHYPVELVDVINNITIETIADV